MRQLTLPQLREQKLGAIKNKGECWALNPGLGGISIAAVAEWELNELNTGSDHFLPFHRLDPLNLLIYFCYSQAVWDLALNSCG